MAKGDADSIQAEIQSLEEKLKRKNKSFPVSVYRIQQLRLGYEQLSPLYLQRLLMLHHSGEKFLHHIEKTKQFVTALLRFFENHAYIGALKAFLNDYLHKVSNKLESDEVGELLDNGSFQENIVEWMEDYENLEKALECVQQELLDVTFKSIETERILNLYEMLYHSDVSQLSACCNDYPGSHEGQEDSILLHTSLYLSTLQRVIAVLRKVLLETIKTEEVGVIPSKNQICSEMKPIFSRFVSYLDSNQPKRILCTDFSEFMENRDIYEGTLGEAVQLDLDASPRNWSQSLSLSPRMRLTQLLSPRKTLVSVVNPNPEGQKLTP